jgi:hypothetical protein
VDLQAVCLTALAPGVDWLFSSSFDALTTARTGRASFDDTASSAFRTDIEWLARAGITKGCSATSFCPDAPVRRQEMAAFLDRALGLSAAPVGDPFVDDGIFEDNIERLAASGVTRECTRRTTTDSVRRVP